MRQRDYEIISLAGDLTWQTVGHLRMRLDEVATSGANTIVLNFADVSFADSSALAAIIAAYRRQIARGGTLMLIEVPDAVMRALRQARLAELIPARGRNARYHDRIVAAPDQEPRMVRTLSVPCDPSRMSQIRAKVAALYESIKLPREEAFDLTLALGEALGNAFDHGMPEAHHGQDGDEAQDNGAQGTVTVSVSLFDDRIITEVTDCGCGMSFSSGDKLPQPSETRGRGIRLMTMLTDSVQIEPKQAGQGTRVRLVKMLQVPLDVLDLPAEGFGAQEA